MGPYLVFMASTINGYEGTGRSLSLKLIQQLRDQSRGGLQASNEELVEKNSDTGTTRSSRSLREITLAEPIRYAQGDAVEKWLNRVLCLDATLPKSRSAIHGTPHPSQCELVHVNRDTLFSFHPVSEKFLQQMMALYVASHYKNSPNDLQLMSDAPAHQLFVLIPPVGETATSLPEPLCVIQVALEGRISKQSVMSSLSRGQRAGGDLIPWLVSQQFQDSEFAGLSGSRVVRIATNPEYLKMGYGSRALELLADFYEGKFASLSEDDPSTTVGGSEHMPRVSDTELESTSLLADDIKIRNINNMPPLFSRLSERTPDALDYIGVSYGLTQQLHKFWKRHNFAPVYLRQTPNDLTGEHSCVMLRPLTTNHSNADPSWLASYASDFHRRFLSLLSYQFRAYAAVQSLSISESASAPSKANATTTTSSVLTEPLTKHDLDGLFSPHDLARLDSYASNMLDYHVILDLLPSIAHLFFTGRMPQVSLSGVQQAILLAIGLQRKDLSDVEKELDVPSSQLLAMFIKVIRKISVAFRVILEADVGRDMPTEAAVSGSRVAVAAPVVPAVEKTNGNATTAYTDHDDKSEDVVDPAIRAKQRELINALPLDRYELDGETQDVAANDEDARWAEAEKQIREGGTPTVSVKSSKKRKAEAEGETGEEAGKKSKKDKKEKGKGHGEKNKKKSKA